MEKSWDEARKTCAIRFNGSPLADLVQLTDKKKVFVEMMLRDIDKDKGKYHDKLNKERERERERGRWEEIGRERGRGGEREREREEWER